MTLKQRLAKQNKTIKNDHQWRERKVRHGSVNRLSLVDDQEKILFYSISRETASLPYLEKPQAQKSCHLAETPLGKGAPLRFWQADQNPEFPFGFSRMDRQVPTQST